MASTVNTEEVVSCDLCGSTAKSVLLDGLQDRFFGLPGRFTLVRCAGCGLVRLSPRPDPESLPLFYPSDSYYAYQADEQPAGVRGLAGSRDTARAAVLHTLGYGDDGLPGWARIMPSRLPRGLVRRAAYDQAGFPPWIPGGRALDVGCGNGVFLDRIRRHGWDVVGVDTSEAATAAAREAFDIEVHVGSLEEAPLGERSFDFVHMSHVIEHLPTPVATLRHLTRLLRPGGLVYIETPNIESLTFRWSRQYWFPLEVPRHLWLFSAATLAESLRGAGLAVTELRARSFPTFEWEETYRLEERRGALLPERPAGRSLRSIPRTALLTGVSRVAGRLSPRHGDVLSCWARSAAA